MPGEVIDRPNPGPLPSQLPDEVAQLAITLESKKLDPEIINALLKFRRAASYVAAGRCSNDANDQTEKLDY